MDRTLVALLFLCAFLISLVAPVATMTVACILCLSVLSTWGSWTLVRGVGTTHPEAQRSSD